MKKKIMSVLIAAVMVLSMTACSSKDEPQTPEAIEEEKTTVEEPDQEIGKDFDADVEAGLLWINDQGQVTDKDGNVIDAYSYIIANDRKTLLSENGMMEGYTMTDDMQIIIDESMEVWEPEPLESTGNPYLDNLRNNVANSDRENAEIVVEENPFGTGDTQTRIASDLNEYHSDIIFGNWWVDKQINGTPIAEQIPMTIARAMANANYSSNSYSEFNATTVLDKFRFVDQDTCTVDSKKRMDSSDTTCYGFYLESCQKNTDDYGNRYFTGYIDTDYVVVYGDFDKILNDDNVFMYADFIGLSDDDVPIFVGAYAEIITE